MEVELVDDKVGGYKVLVDGTNFGSFDQINGNLEPFCFFPKLTDRMSGDHFIVIGQMLNSLNQKFNVSA
ncbi:hypothetical protein CAG54_10965 [Vibrio sp. V27_P1S3P104]|uniref:Uncharacterized protein n=1 Tax=Vibrio neptunius TaxID=170651 RepID=A0ABS3A4S5_9VIBR|nr:MULTISPECIES: hypothetical protein [Vibrio]MBN3494749.1 hypothetical protein [Vibrio neptunius]MBN3517105.1 hypothetical protein [Vibrio neptunius]MBN3551209.1 hypothetical protein [Vibrio neptunius]MBN3579501.1 hypothetical protein [Vibrio neptunius]MCH9873166.1 hypothetical protein [Vibrio neptunius]